MGPTLHAQILDTSDASGGVRGGPGGATGSFPTLGGPWPGILSRQNVDPGLGVLSGVFHVKQGVQIQERVTLPVRPSGGIPIAGTWRGVGGKVSDPLFTGSGD